MRYAINITAVSQILLGRHATNFIHGINNIYINDLPSFVLSVKEKALLYPKEFTWK